MDASGPEKVRCGRCGEHAQVGESGLALLPGWSAIFVHQEVPADGDPAPLGYACPHCTRIIIPMYDRNLKP